MRLVLFMPAMPGLVRTGPGATQNERILYGAPARAIDFVTPFISADFDEILEVSDRIVVMFEGQVMGEYPGKNPPIQEISLAMAGK